MQSFVIGDTKYCIQIAPEAESVREKAQPTSDTED